MTTVTINESATPSEQVLANADKTVKIVDSRGRTITLKKPKVLAQFDLIEALGESAKNEVFMAMNVPMIYVTAIDDEQLAPPRERIHVRALIAQLGEEGVNAVMAGVQEHFGNANAEGDRAAIKK